MIPRLSPGDAVDYNLVNALIDRINRLESANNFQAVWKYDSSAVGSSLTDTMMMQAGSVVLTNNANGNNWVYGDIMFPVPFVQTPIVLIGSQTPHTTFGHNVDTVTLTRARAVLQINPASRAIAMWPIRCSWMAIGPVASTAIT